jgi:hypothetical protein
VARLEGNTRSSCSAAVGAGQGHQKQAGAARRGGSPLMLGSERTLGLRGGSTAEALALGPLSYCQRGNPVPGRVPQLGACRELPASYSVPH